MNFLNKVKQGMTKFFYGRYGSDQLNFFLLILSIILVNIKYGYFLSYPVLAIAIFRSLSKNITTRRKEGDWFNKNIWFKIRNAYYHIKNRSVQRKNFSYFKCSNCRKKLRVPKNKGRIKTTCPSCHQVTIRKT